MAAAAIISRSSLYNPAPVQQEFHLCTANEILLGGAAGPGKSLALLMDPIQTQVIYEHEKWKRTGVPSVGWAIHFRRTFPRLKQTIERSRRIFKQFDPEIRGVTKGATFNEDDYMWTFTCGYKLQFGHVKDEKNIDDYFSSEYSHISYDELREFTQTMYETINTRLRSSDHDLQKRLRIVAATNPTGNWVKDYFYTPAPEGRKLITSIYKLDDGTTQERTRVFIPALLKDNPDPEFRRRYEVELQSKPAPLRLALLRGNWDVIEGAFFADDFDPDVHVVESYKPPSGHPRFRSADWGFKNPTVILYWSIDTDGNLDCYREITIRRKDAAEIAAIIKQIETEADEWDENRDCSRLTGPIDTQVWETRGTVGPTIAESMMEAGVYWEKCTKNKLQATQQLLSRLRDRTGEKGRPAIRFHKCCKDTIRTLPAIGTDETNSELPADGGEDHWLDAVLYACMYRAREAKSDERPHSQKYDDDLAEARRKRVERQRRGGRYGYGGH